MLITQSVDKLALLDAIFFPVRITFENIDINIIYDATISSLANINNSMGRVELGIAYAFEGNCRRGVSCPKL